jgi:inward rectifier potassium channel
MSIFNPKNNNERELGFGTKNYSRSVRFLGENGKVNIKRTGLGGLNNTDVYHWLITTSIIKLISIILVAYVAVNLIFATAYYMLDSNGFGGLNDANETAKFMSLFFFSAQTLTTLGYGHIYPISDSVSVIAAIESLMGLMTFALATGIIFGRFSRPRADLLYSKNILVAPYGDITGLMFRIANKKQYELIECEASVVISYNEPESKKREFDNLKLEINKINFLALSWTIVHPIDAESPIYGLTAKDLEERDAEVLILIKGINDTFSQTVYSRYSYKGDDFVSQAKFKPLKQEADKTGRIVISVTDIHHYNEVM